MNKLPPWLHEGWNERWYKCGRMMERGEVLNGKKVGVWQGWYQNGNEETDPKRRRFFGENIFGFRRYESLFDENGKRIVHITGDKDGNETFREDLRE